MIRTILVAMLTLVALTGCAQLQGVLASAIATAKTQVAEPTPLASSNVEPATPAATTSTILFALDPQSEAATISNDYDIEEVLRFTAATSGNPATPSAITIKWTGTAPNDLVLAAQLNKSDGKYISGVVNWQEKTIKFSDPSFFALPANSKSVFTLLVKVDIKLITDTAQKINFDIVEVEHSAETEVRGIPLEGRSVHVRMTTFEWDFK